MKTVEATKPYEVDRSDPDKVTIRYRSSPEARKTFKVMAAVLMPLSLGMLLLIPIGLDSLDNNNRTYGTIVGLVLSSGMAALWWRDYRRLFREQTIELFSDRLVARNRAYNREAISSFLIGLQGGEAAIFAPINSPTAVATATVASALNRLSAKGSFYVGIQYGNKEIMIAKALSEYQANEIAAAISKEWTDYVS